MAEKAEVAVTFDDKLKSEIARVSDALPKTLNKERFLQNALAVVYGNTDLQKCNKQKIITGLLKGAYLGLDFANKECYLIPYGGDVQFQTDYKGECKFVKRYSIRPILDIDSKVVRKGDEFNEYTDEDGNLRFDFKPIPFSDADIVGAFAYVKYKDGGMIFETMSVAEINSVRNNYSKARDSKMWKCSFGEACKKTVLRRLCKHIETDFETIEARNAWEDGADTSFERPSVDETVVNAFEKSEETEVFDSEIVSEEVIETPLDIPIPEEFK